MSEEGKKPFYKKWWGIVLIAVGLIIVVNVASGGGDTSEDATPATQETQAETKDSATDSTPQEADKPVDETKTAKSLTEIYDAISLGMTEEQVKKVAGKPAMTSSAEIEQFGQVTNLVYTSGMNSVTVSVQNGNVKMIVIGEWDGESLSTRSKM